MEAECLLSRTSSACSQKGLTRGVSQAPGVGGGLLVLCVQHLDPRCDVDRLLVRPSSPCEHKGLSIGLWQGFGRKRVRSKNKKPAGPALKSF